MAFSNDMIPPPWLERQFYSDPYGANGYAPVKQRYLLVSPLLSISECHLEVVVRAPSGMSIGKVTHVRLAMDDQRELNQAVMIRHKSALHVVSIWGNYVGLCSQDRFVQVASMSWGVRVIEASGIMAAGTTRVTCPVMLKQLGPDLQLWLKNQEIMGMSVWPLHLRTMSGDGAVVSGSYVRPHLSDVIPIGALCPAYKCYILVPETLVMKPAGERGLRYMAHLPSLVYSEVGLQPDPVHSVDCEMAGFLNAKGKDASGEKAQKGPFGGKPLGNKCAQSLARCSAWMVGSCGTSHGDRSELEPMEQDRSCE